MRIGVAKVEIQILTRRMDTYVQVVAVAPAAVPTRWINTRRRMWIENGGMSNMISKGLKIGYGMKEAPSI